MGNEKNIEGEKQDDKEDVEVEVQPEKVKEEIVEEPKEEVEKEKSEKEGVNEEGKSKEGLEIYESKLLEKPEEFEATPANDVKEVEDEIEEEQKESSLNRYFSLQNNSYDDINIMDEYEPEEDHLDAERFIEPVPLRPSSGVKKTSTSKTLAPIKEVVGRSASRTSLNSSRSSSKAGGLSSQRNVYGGLRSGTSSRAGSTVKPVTSTRTKPSTVTRTRPALASTSKYGNTSTASRNNDRLNSSKSSVNVSAKKPGIPSFTTKPAQRPTLKAGTGLGAKTGVTSTGVNRPAAPAKSSASKPTISSPTKPTTSSASRLARPGVTSTTSRVSQPSTGGTVRSKLSSLAKDHTPSYRR